MWVTRVPYTGSGGRKRALRRVGMVVARRTAPSGERGAVWLKLDLVGDAALWVLSNVTLLSNRYGDAEPLESRWLRFDPALTWIDEHIVPGLVSKALPAPKADKPEGAWLRLLDCEPPLAREAHAAALSELARTEAGVDLHSAIEEALTSAATTSWVVPLEEPGDQERYVTIFNAYVKAAREATRWDTAPAVKKSASPGAELTARTREYEHDHA